MIREWTRGRGLSGRARQTVNETERNRAKQVLYLSFLPCVTPTEGTMSSESNSEIVRRVLEQGFGDGDLSVID